MMRANAAAGAEVVINFTSAQGYTLGQTIYANADWTNTEGYSYNYIRDNSGTRVARQEGPGTPHIYIGDTFSDDREVYAILNDKEGVAGAVCRVYLYITDANNCCYVDHDNGNYVKFRQFIGGVEQANSASIDSGSLAVSGTKLTISRVGTAITVKKDTTTITTKTLAGSPASAQPGFYCYASSPTTNYNEIREFGAKDL